MLVEGKWDKESLWVDKDTCILTCGSDRDRVLAAEVADGKLQVSYGVWWEEYIFSTDQPDNPFWKKVIEEAETKLTKKQTATKGIGKGKPRK